VRREAARYLGDLGTPEAKKTLLKIVYADNEPMVLQEAVRSLGKIGNNDNGEVTATIAWALRRFDVLNPDNLLALAALDAFEVMSKTENGLDASAIQTIQRIATNASYIKPVQRRAMELLGDLRKTSAEKQQKQ
jgi:HEAT repeat protein